MLWVFVTLLAIILLVVVSFVQIEVYFHRQHQDDEIQIKVVALYGLVKIRFNIPVIKIKQRYPGVEVQAEAEAAKSDIASVKIRNTITPNTIMQLFQRARKRIREVYGLLEWTKQTLQYVRCEQIQWQSKLGTGDAAETGVLTGVAWGVKTSILGFGLKYLDLRTIPKLNVVPLYEQRHFYSELHCILRIRVAHAMLQGIRFIPRWIKGKGGEGKWQNILFRA